MSFGKHTEGDDDNLRDTLRETKNSNREKQHDETLVNLDINLKQKNLLSTEFSGEIFSILGNEGLLR